MFHVHHSGHEGAREKVTEQNEDNRNQQVVWFLRERIRHHVLIRDGRQHHQPLEGMTPERNTRPSVRDTNTRAEEDVQSLQGGG